MRTILQFLDNAGRDPRLLCIRLRRQIFGMSGKPIPVERARRAELQGRASVGGSHEGRAEESQDRATRQSHSEAFQRRPESYCWLEQAMNNKWDPPECSSTIEVRTRRRGRSLIRQDDEWRCLSYRERSAECLRKGSMTAIAFPDLDHSILSRRDEIIAGLAALLPRECLVTSDDERRAFETDALTAYRRLPLAVALPRTTEEASAVMRYCFEHGVKVVARGAGTSLAGGAIPQEDAVVLCVAKMTRILSVDYANRTMRVEAGVTNLGITEAVMADGFFYAPDPSSQLACTIAGNIGMNSGGAHCLKYGVTTNNVLGVRLVLVDGTIVEIGGDHLDSPGLDLLGLMIGSEGQLGIVTEATVRILRSAEGARPVLFGFPTSEEAGACVADIIGHGIIPVAMEFMDKLAIEICEAFAHAGYPLDAGALLIIEVEGSEEEMETQER